jgi:hypothetical protein
MLLTLKAQRSKSFELLGGIINFSYQTFLGFAAIRCRCLQKGYFFRPLQVFERLATPATGKLLQKLYFVVVS